MNIDKSEVYQQELNKELWAKKHKKHKQFTAKVTRIKELSNDTVLIRAHDVIVEEHQST